MADDQSCTKDAITPKDTTSFQIELANKLLPSSKAEVRLIDTTPLIPLTMAETGSISVSNASTEEPACKACNAQQ